MKTKVLPVLITLILLALIIVFALLSKKARCPYCHQTVGKNSECEYCRMQSAFYDSAKDKARDGFMNSLNNPIEGDLLVPEEDLAVPENAKFVPEDAKIAPQDAKIAPQDAKIVPEDAKIASGEAKFAPEGANFVPEEKSLFKAENLSKFKNESKALENAKVVGFARFSQWRRYVRGNGKAYLGAFFIIMGIIIFYDYPIVGTGIILVGIGILIIVNRKEKPKELETDCQV